MWHLIWVAICKINHAMTWKSYLVIGAAIAGVIFIAGFIGYGTALYFGLNHGDMAGAGVGLLIVLIIICAMIHAEIKYVRGPEGKTMWDEYKGRY